MRRSRGREGLPFLYSFFLAAGVWDSEARLTGCVTDSRARPGARPTGQGRFGTPLEVGVRLRTRKPARMGRTAEGGKGAGADVWGPHGSDTGVGEWGPRGK